MAAGGRPAGHDQNIPNVPIDNGVSRVQSGDMNATATAAAANTWKARLALTEWAAERLTWTRLEEELAATGLTADELSALAAECLAR